MTEPRRIGDTPQGGPVQSFYARKGTARRPAIARGEGIYLWDVAGRRYLDASSGPVVSNLGHGNRRVLDAMRAQAEAVTFAYPGLFESDANVALADLVCKLAGPGLDRAFFVSGGSEATEAAIKLARQYALAIGQPDRVTVIGGEPSYHGATLGALAVTGDHHAEEIFGPLMRSMPKIPAPLSYRVPAGHTVASHALACAQAQTRSCAGARRRCWPSSSSRSVASPPAREDEDSQHQWRIANINARIANINALRPRPPGPWASSP